MPGQTLTQIRALLDAAGLAPQHRFGQNFLIDLNLLAKVVAAAELSPDDVVLEVGPGTGSLTELLLESGPVHPRATASGRGGPRVVCVEIDRGFQNILRARLGGRPNFTLIAGDALAGKHALNAEMIAALQRTQPGPGGARKLVANLPYQIATPLLVELLHWSAPALERLVATIQREVADRLLAGAGDHAYGPLSVIVQTLARVERLASLPPRAFWPAPQVDSALVRLTPPGSRAEVTDVSAFTAFVQRAFQQRRKTLRRTLHDWPPEHLTRVLAELGATPAVRPEGLSPAAWRRLFAAIPPVRS